MAMTYHNAKPGEYCENGPYQERWTCPNCYHDHEEEVTKCEGCGIALECTTEHHPVSRCTVADPVEDTDADL